MKKYMLILLSTILALVLLFLVLGSRGGKEDTQVLKTELGVVSVKSILIDVDTADLTVLTGNSDSAYVETVGSDVTALCQNEELTVRTASERHASNASVTVYLPKGTCPETCSIELGVGKLTVRDIAFTEGSISCGVGDSSITFAEIPEKLTVKSGSGDVSAAFPGTDEIRIRAPFGLGARDYGERFILDEASDILIDVSLGNTTLR